MTRKPLSTPLELTRKPYPVEAAALRRAKPLSTRIEAALETQWARKSVQRVELDLPMPPSVNDLWLPVRRRTKAGNLAMGIAKTEAYADWRRAAGVSINRQKPGRVSGWFAASVLLELRDGGQPRDLDNYGSKAIMDALQENGVIDNDSWLWKYAAQWSRDIHGAMIILTAIIPHAKGLVA